LQVAIDSAKRRFSVNVTDEIKRIKQLVDVKSNGYPLFWLNIRRGFNPQLINDKIVCPMNILHGYNLPKQEKKSPAVPIANFFVHHKAPEDKRFAKKVEEFIQKYSIKLTEYNRSEEQSYDDYLLLRYDYEEMIEDIRRLSMSKNTVALMSWLINRAFMITPQIKKNDGTISSKLWRNKSLLLKTLYDANSKALLKCFEKNHQKVE